MMSQPNQLLEMIVAELLAEHPEAAPVFLKYRMNCLGCEMSPFETLGDALRIYHLPIQPFLQELNAALNIDHPPE
jgi:hybrid cluster-associated redox disulfide protein